MNFFGIVFEWFGILIKGIFFGYFSGREIFSWSDVMEEGMFSLLILIINVGGKELSLENLLGNMVLRFLIFFFCFFKKFILEMSMYEK